MECVKTSFGHSRALEAPQSPEPSELSVLLLCHSFHMRVVVSQASRATGWGSTRACAARRASARSTCAGATRRAASGAAPRPAPSAGTPPRSPQTSACPVSHRGRGPVSGFCSVTENLAIWSTKFSFQSERSRWRFAPMLVRRQHLIASICIVLKLDEFPTWKELGDNAEPVGVLLTEEAREPPVCRFTQKQTM